MAVNSHPEITRQIAMLNDTRLREALRTLFEAVLADIAALKVDVTAQRTAIVGITAKLDADGGVTDADYAATWDPAAITVVPELTA